MWAQQSPPKATLSLGEGLGVRPGEGGRGGVSIVFMVFGNLGVK